jgi:uncharacterized protein
MQDFLAALGLLLAIEGLLFAAFPNATRRAMREASESQIISSAGSALPPP